MVFKLFTTPEAEEQFKALKKDKSAKKDLKAMEKALHLLKENPRHPSLNTHKYSSIQGPEPRVTVFEAYAQNKTPAAYRIFWCYYPPEKNSITIIAIIPHP